MGWIEVACRHHKSLGEGALHIHQLLRQGRLLLLETHDFMLQARRDFIDQAANLIGRDLVKVQNGAGLLDQTFDCNDNIRREVLDRLT